MTILLSGIHGFVGFNLVNTFKKHHSIYGIDIVFPEREGINKTFSWDELEIIPEVDVIIHLAGKAHDTKNICLIQEYFDINLGLTKRIFDYFIQSNAKQFFFFSSIKVASDFFDGDSLKEDVRPKPVGPYSESKFEAEKYILSKQGEIDYFTKKVYIFRPCMIHGPGNKGNLNLLYHFVSKGVPWPLGAFENKRSVLNVSNLSFIIEKFILLNPNSGIYHLADDEPISTNELIELIAKSKNKKIKILKINCALIRMIAKIGTACKLPFNNEKLRKLTENYVVSNQRMKQAIGIERLPYNVKEGLIDTLKSFN